MIEQLAVVVKTDPAIEQVAAAGDARRINVANRTDHQIKRQPKLGTKLGQHPEHGGPHFLVFVGTEIQPVNRLADRRDRSPRRCAAGDEVGRQTDRACPGTTLDESLEQSRRWPLSGLPNPERRHPRRLASGRSSWVRAASRPGRRSAGTARKPPCPSRPADRRTRW